ncbi:MAG: HYExAFE family protein [Lacipirellulaceae bacterium]
MAKRHNHYEAALEDYLRAERLPYVAVDERRRALDDDGSLKSVDFVVSGPVIGLATSDPSPWSLESDAPPAHATRWLIDVKGRRFPSGEAHPQYWRNWTTGDELDSLVRWSRRFGAGFDALLVFAYHLVGERSPVPAEQVHYFRDEPYAFVAVRLGDYRRVVRPLSPKWGTVSAPVAEFRRIARPLLEVVRGCDDRVAASPAADRGA